VEREAAITGTKVAEGDIVLGLASSGVHSNGYSLVRKIVEASGLSYDSDAPFAKGEQLGRALLTPTRIYVKSCLAAIRAESSALGGVKALAHITGGGLLENIPRVLPQGLACDIDAGSWPLPPVFAWMRKVAGTDAHEMARTFNCGIGMILVVARDDAALVAKTLRDHGETVNEIGRIVPRAEGAVGCDVRNTGHW
jgi:phosphoribosylformylglycinamidine cyclo-ligase